MNRATLFLLVAAPGLLLAHPMGNFSVNHYARVEVTATGVQLDYVLDLAEIPSFELLHSWNLQSTSPRSDLNARALKQARLWLKDLKVSLDGRPLSMHFRSADLFLADGAANLPVMRIAAHASAEAGGGELSYEDLNYPDRAGWKEIVIVQGSGATLERASQTDRDISKALTAYPPDPTLAPPQDLRARIVWKAAPIISEKTRPIPTATHAEAQTVTISRIEQPRHAPPAVSPAALNPQSARPGTVVRGDFLSRLLHNARITAWMLLLALAVAFGLGAMHALTPGHGKTIVAAYLIGSRGTMKHAAFLGAMVTFTHTISVFVLGIATLFLFQWVVPEKIAQACGVVSGISIVGIGGWMLYRRMCGSRQGHSHSHHDNHSHDHDHGHNHGGHTHSHSHTHENMAGAGHVHSHVPETLSWAGLVALGISGGLVPCESALVLMLSAIALGRAAFGLLLLVAFSLGLAIVLVAIGVLVVYAKHLLPKSSGSRTGAAVRWLSTASAAVVIVIGLLMTGVSAGILQSRWIAW